MARLCRSRLLPIIRKSPPVDKPFAGIDLCAKVAPAQSFVAGTTADILTPQRHGHLGHPQDLFTLQPQRGQKIGRSVDVHGVWWHTHESNSSTTRCRSTRASSCPDALLDQLDHARAAGYAVRTSVRAWWTSANATNTIATIRK